MTLLTAAILARHVPDHHPNPYCQAGDGEWPCDTAIVLAALDVQRVVPEGILRDAAVMDLRAKLEAAIEREQRLRAALSRVTDVPLNDIDDWLAAYDRATTPASAPVEPTAEGDW